MAMLPALAALLLLATPVAAMDGMEQRLGAALFDKLWVPAPASTRASDGLGPLYNARSCASCHAQAGRGRMPARPGDRAPALVLRLGGAEGGADPLYGRQIQDRAIQGHRPEARLALRWTEDRAPLPGAAPVVLRRPWPELAPLAGPLAPDSALSLRLAPPLAGRGGLEAVPEAAILAREDAADRDGDGISGRANRVGGQIGRFGAKAASPTLADFIAIAFATDIGIGSPLRPGGAGDCTAPACRAAPTGDSPAQDGQEIGAEGIALVAAYLRGLPVPAVADHGAGEGLFAASGCPACHVPALPGPAGALPAYTDLLLHDMGDGLADGLAEGAATGREWRTAPLIGLGAAQPSGGGGFLHDGRAGDLTQAILWHGGEAAAARDRFAALPAADRETLIRFLEGL